MSCSQQSSEVKEKSPAISLSESIIKTSADGGDTTCTKPEVKHKLEELIVAIDLNFKFTSLNVFIIIYKS